MLIRDGNRIESNVFSSKLSHPRIALKLMKRMNCIGYMMKKSAIFVDGENKSKNILEDDTIHVILVLRAYNYLCFCKHFLGFMPLN